MRFCDVTLSYSETSGGIRTYLDAKRAHLLEHTDHEHVLVIPDEEDAIERDGRLATVRIAAPHIPGQPYRFFPRQGPVLEALRAAAPDVIEVGNVYVEPWAAFAYRNERAGLGADVVVGGYFHTDVAEAYVGAPIREAVQHALGGWSDLLAGFGLKVAETFKAGAEAYVEAVLSRCDVVMAATPGQVERLGEYGVEGARLVPLGVDLERFHPDRRRGAVRERYGASTGRLLMVYGGRLDGEKHPGLLLDAYKRLPPGLDAVLVLRGEGPLREDLAARAEALPDVHVLPYESDPDAFAELLASADLYVTAGPHETFGLSVIEAQAAGLPVVGVEAGALVERVPDGLGFLGPVDDADAFAENVARAAAGLDALSAAARRHVEAHFSWGRTFETLLETYHRAVEDARTGTGAE